MKPVALWTDVLIWLLVAAAVLYGVQVRRREYLLAPWRRVARSSAAMACACVLGVYLAIGLLDSIHFRPALPPAQPGAEPSYSFDVQSVLDLVLARLRAGRERTYSAPLAIVAYAKDTAQTENSHAERDYPRLLYAGTAVRDPREHLADLSWRAAVGLVAGGACWAALVILATAATARTSGMGFRLRWQAIWSLQTSVRWRAAYLAALAILLIGGAVVAWALEYHVLGTDKVGRDVLYESLKSIRTALVIGTLTTFVMLPFALGLGIAAGYFKGWVDDAVQYVYTVLNSIPSVLLIAATVLVIQVKLEEHPELFVTTAERADIRLLCLCLILGITSWTSLARLLRGETLKLRELEYVQAAQTFGVSHWRIMATHIARNIMHLAIISLVMDFSGLVLAEAVLSYIGVGVDPSTDSFGTMINAARLELSREPMVWWSLAAAFTFMLVLVLAANLFADAVRDAFDPRTALTRPRRLAAPVAADPAPAGRAS